MTTSVTDLGLNSNDICVYSRQLATIRRLLADLGEDLETSLTDELVDMDDSNEVDRVAELRDEANTLAAAVDQLRLKFDSYTGEDAEVLSPSDAAAEADAAIDATTRTMRELLGA